MTGALTEKEVSELATTWYKALDVHAPMVELLPMLSETKLEMKFPEMTLTSYAGFEAWYQRVIRIFFDEVHTVKSVKCTPDGDGMKAEVIVHWEASMWNAPEATSKRIMLDANQTWRVIRDEKTGKAVISQYTVNGFEYMAGSARL